MSQLKSNLILVLVRNKYRVVKIKGRYGYPWYVPQRLSVDDTWEDISLGYINKEAAMEKIAREPLKKLFEKEGDR